jgi:hypothetical protein
MPGTPPLLLFVPAPVLSGQFVQAGNRMKMPLYTPTETVL